MHRRPLLIQSLLRAALRSLEPWLRSLQNWFRAVPSRLRALEPWLRSLSLESVLRDAEHLARRPSRLTLGVAAGTVLATAAVLAAVSAGSAAPAAALSDQDVSRPAAPAVAAGPAAPTQAAGHAAPTRASSQHLARPAAPAKPYLIYDSVTPGSIPASQGAVATYADGPHPTPASEVTGRKSVLWISITGQDYDASVVDVEPGNATPAAAASWAWHRLSASPHAVARIYTMINEWPAVKSAVASFPAQMQSRIHWWIANPTGSPHLLPGSDATQWYWGSQYDITTAAPGF